MKSWSRRSDDARVIGEARTLSFEGPNGPYEVLLKPEMQDFPTVRIDGRKECRPIAAKSIGDSSVQLCRVADCILEVLEAVCWPELEVGSQDKSTYWGDTVIYRSDTSMS